MNRKIFFILFLIALPLQAQITGTLKWSYVNRRYLVSSTDTTKAIFISGDHIWGGLQDGKATYPTDSIYQGDHHWDTLSANHLNFTKLWIWREADGVPESANHWYWYPEVYKRTGPGNASDGRLKFNLDSVNAIFLQRQYDYCDSLRKRNIYVVIMLTNGWDNSQYYMNTGNPWTYHAFNGSMNMNGIDADVDHNGQGDELYYVPADGGNAAAYAKLMASCKTIVTYLNPLPNVIYETTLEIGTTGNQKYKFLRALTDSINSWQTSLTYQHPVMNGGAWDINNDSLFNMNGTIVNPGGNPAATFWDNAPIDSNGHRVVIIDTDHLEGMVSTDKTAWVWQCFTTGQGGVVLQDNFCSNPSYPGWSCDGSTWPAMRRAMGQATLLAESCDLLHMVHNGTISSTSSYAMASPHSTTLKGQVVVYQASGTVTVNLSSYDSVDVMWYSANTFQTSAGTKVAGGASRDFTAPASQYDVLYLKENSIQAIPSTITKSNWRWNH